MSSTPSMVLPIVTADDRTKLMGIIAEDETAWKKEILNHIKDENPEINSLLLELAEGSADPKGVIFAGFAVFRLLEMAQEGEMI